VKVIIILTPSSTGIYHYFAVYLINTKYQNNHLLLYRKEKRYVKTKSSLEPSILYFSLNACSEEMVLHPRVVCDGRVVITLLP